MVKTDVLIIGSGIAGMTAALTVADAGLNVIIVFKGNTLSDSTSRHAQGGIIYNGLHDSPHALAADIIKAGAGICKRRAVEILVEDGPKRVHDILIKRAKVPFTKNKNSLDRIREAAHRSKRIIHCQDYTGQAITHALAAEVRKHNNITIMPLHMALDIITPEHHSNNPKSVYETTEALGVYLLNLKTHKVHRAFGAVTILATGGIGALFRHTTNPSSATGDGIAMAYRAGAKVINLEYTQFHPTTLYTDDEQRFLISEAVRGEGARLRTRSGKLFMKKYHPDGSLASRDIVARAIHAEMLRTNSPYVLIDVKGYISTETIQKRFPMIYTAVSDHGIDMTQQHIPVVPAMHFSCGGIKIDDYGRTTIQRLYAIGECACSGLHGANRLASTSLLEGLVWGWRSAKSIIRNKKELIGIDIPRIPQWDDSGLSKKSDPALIRQDWITLKSTMWNYVGLIRSRSRLKRAINDLRYLSEEIEEFYRHTKLTNGLIELRNALRTGLAVAQAAWVNRISRGCHYRED